MLLYEKNVVHSLREGTGGGNGATLCQQQDGTLDKRWDGTFPWSAQVITWLFETILFFNGNLVKRMSFAFCNTLITSTQNLHIVLMLKDLNSEEADR